ncbi:UNVERIFIED_CONTAM: hypothetical protein GTU68_057015 [Idotea baltica]|nr:hypothetical protein [Idotea baltica]
MTNNDVFRRLRYTFNLSDSQVISIFKLTDMDVSRAQISDWLKSDEDPSFVACNDIDFANFLNGFIVEKRGKKDGPAPIPEKRLSNNIIFTKLKIALNLRAEDVLEILQMSDFRMSKHELSALFRKPDHKHFRKCKDQILRNFLKGLQIKHRDETQSDAKQSEDLAND